MILISIQDCIDCLKYENKLLPSCLSSFYTKDKFYLEEHDYYQYVDMENISSKQYNFNAIK